MKHLLFSYALFFFPVKTQTFVCEKPVQVWFEIC